MRLHQVVVTSILIAFCSTSVAVTASYEELEKFVQEEAYIIANNLKITDIVKEKRLLRLRPTALTPTVFIECQEMSRSYPENMAAAVLPCN